LPFGEPFVDGDGNGTDLVCQFVDQITFVILACCANSGAACNAISRTVLY